MLVIKMIGMVLFILFILFILSFIIYFFNLDMKFAAKLIPFMSRHYDRVKRKRKG